MKLIFVFFLVLLTAFYEFIVKKVVKVPEIPRQNTQKSPTMTSIFWLLVMLQEVTLQIISLMRSNRLITPIKATIFWNCTKIRGPTRREMRKRTEWTMLLSGLTVIKWWRRPYDKLKYEYYKLYNKYITRLVDAVSAAKLINFYQKVKRKIKKV